MKLSVWAKEKGLSYKTAWRYFKAGTLRGTKLPSGTIIIEETDTINNDLKVAIYARVSSSENRDNLNKQAERLLEYCTCKGYKVSEVVKEIGSGLNDKRNKLEKLLLDKTISIIVVEHKDRLCRFGLNYIEKLLEQNNRHIEIVNKVSLDEEDIIQDFVSIITSFCARLYGKRRSKRKTEQLIKELQS